MNGHHIDIVESARRNALSPAEREAEALCDRQAKSIGGLIMDAIAALPVRVGQGTTLAPKLCRNLADRIVQMFSGAVLAAIEGEAAVAELNKLREASDDTRCMLRNLEADLREEDAQLHFQRIAVIGMAIDHLDAALPAKTAAS